MSVINAFFVNMGKVIPYFKMTPELAKDLHSTLAKVMMYVKSKGIKLTQKQQDHIINQTKQLELFDKSMAPKVAKGPKAEVVDLSKKLPESAPYSEKNPKGWMPKEDEVVNPSFNTKLVDDTIDLLMNKSDPKSFQDELVKIMTRKGTYADYSEAEIKAILDSLHPEGFAVGGRVGLNKGLVDMMINFVLKNKNLVQEFFSVTPKQVTREALENMARQNMAGLKKMYNLIAERVGGATKVPEQVTLTKLLKNEGLKFNKHIDDTMDNFFQRSGDIKYDADALTDSFFEGIGSTVDDVSLTEKLKVYDAFYKKLAKERYGMMMKKNASKDMYTKAANDELDAMEAAADVGMKDPMGLTAEEIYTKYQGKITDDLLKNIVKEANPQRQAEVMGTVDEVLTMMDKGMDKDQILSVLKNMKRTKNSEGGLNYLVGM